MKRGTRMSLTAAVSAAGVVLIGLFGCTMDIPGPGGDPVARALKDVIWSAWSEPVPLAGLPNSPANEGSPFLSRDELSLYFASDRTGAVGGSDIWVSGRARVEDPWGAPVNLQIVNTASTEQAPYISNDGHLLFFSSTRDGTFDIFVSRRTDPNDDLCWEPPVKLEAGVNTDEYAENAPVFLQRAEEGPVNLYFNRAVEVGFPDIYCAAISRRGKTLTDAVSVEELNLVGTVDAAVSIRRDGLEIFFWSTREVTADLFSSTRDSVYDPWATPVKVGTPLSTAAGEFQPRLSFDARTLIFSSNRAPTVGGTDLWISTRTKVGRE